MAEGLPVSVDHIQVKKHLLPENDVLASMDKGCSLVKLLYVSRDSLDASKDSETVTVTLELYLNRDFKFAIDSLLKNVAMPEDPSKCFFKVTGAGCEKEIEMLRERAPFQVKFIDEFFAQASGNRWSIQNVDESELCYPRDEFAEEIKIPEAKGLWKKISDKMLSQVGDVTPQTTAFPCIVAFLGSGAGYIKILEDGQLSAIGGLALGGKSFLGLSKLLLRTKNYDEIIDLAEKGDLKNVDTQLKEIFTNAPDSKYGENDPERPIFAFGKAVDQDKDLSDFNREDVADSLLHMYASNLLNSVTAFARAHQIRRIYLGGNLCRGRYMRKVITQQSSFLASKFVDIIFLKTGHTGCFGALMAANEGTNSLW